MPAVRAPGHRARLLKPVCGLQAGFSRTRSSASGCRTATVRAVFVAMQRRRGSRVCQCVRVLARLLAPCSDVFEPRMQTASIQVPTSHSSSGASFASLWKTISLCGTSPSRWARRLLLRLLHRLVLMMRSKHSMPAFHGCAKCVRYGCRTAQSWRQHSARGCRPRSTLARCTPPTLRSARPTEARGCACFAADAWFLHAVIW